MLAIRSTKVATTITASRRGTIEQATIRIYITTVVYITSRTEGARIYTINNIGTITIGLMLEARIVV